MACDACRALHRGSILYGRKWVCRCGEEGSVDDLPDLMRGGRLMPAIPDTGPPTLAEVDAWRDQVDAAMANLEKKTGVRYQPCAGDVFDVALQLMLRGVR